MTMPTMVGIGVGIRTPDMKSMTAYAEACEQCPEGQAHWVIRSVNHRYLDAQLRLPDDFRHLESSLRQTLKEGLARGKVEATFHFTPDAGQAAQSMALDPVVSEHLTTLANQLGRGLEHAQVDLARLLHWPGLVQHQKANLAAVDAVCESLFQRALERLIEARAVEGEAIGEMLKQRLDAMEGHVRALKDDAPRIRVHLTERLHAKLQALDVSVDAQRMEQEVALLVQKADVDEELDRLAVHMSEIRRVMSQAEPCGRRLDFLIQELNREANTLGSKAALVETSQASVELKVLIEQLREQIQNIE